MGQYFRKYAKDAAIALLKALHTPQPLYEVSEL